MNEDGYPDLICQFEDNPENWVPGNDMAGLTGVLFDGTTIIGGIDSIVTISEPDIINGFISFEPISSTYASTTDTTGCQAGVKGKFSFTAQLTNISNSTLSALEVKIATLTNGNLLLTSNGLIGVGESFEVLQQDGYADGELSFGEFVKVPFTVCLTIWNPFDLYVDVFGITN